MPERRLSKTEFVPFLDVSDTPGSGSENWGRIDKSTIFNFAANPQSESLDYISTETPVEEVKNYTPELPMEIALYQGNKVYDFLLKKFYGLPIGDGVFVPFLMCFGGDEALAWKTKATLLLGGLDTVAGKLTFNLKIGGDIERGTHDIANGQPTFTPND